MRSYPRAYAARRGCRAPTAERSLTARRKGVSVHMMDGWDWVWMPFMMVFWLVVLGAVIYVAVRLANRPPR
jgi:hypothetical protein